jgi:hypothetical protein
MVIGFRQRISLERRVWRAFTIDRAFRCDMPKCENPINETIRKKILELERRHHRLGLPRIYQLLHKQGHRINHNRVLRLFLSWKISGYKIFISTDFQKRCSL